MVARFLFMLLSVSEAFLLMPKNSTGRVAGDLTMLKRYVYRWDMPEDSESNEDRAATPPSIPSIPTPPACSTIAQ